MELGVQRNVVFHDKKLVLMILRKNGSGTLHKTILRSLGHKNVSGNNINKVIGHQLVSLNKYEVDKLDYTKVVWVRNPFNRLVSGWFHRIQHKPEKYVKKMFGISRFTPFEDFIEWTCSIEDASLNVHFRQQTHDITIDGRLVPNFIIKLENLNEGWKRLQKQHPWLADIKGRTHATKKGDYRKYYTDDLIEKVRIRFKDDLNLLGYDFGR